MQRNSEQTTIEMGKESSAQPCRRVVILGSTGSIGTSALKVAEDIPGRMEVVGLAAGRQWQALARQIRETGVRHAAIWDEEAHLALAAEVGGEVSVGCGESGLVELARLPEADMVIIAIVGVAGLRPALAAIEAGKDIAVASKEILVMAGEVVMEAARRKGVRVLPVDSEHNAIFQ
jgi:1-deoxy-D-xylulose-5-phosphate reductoisomerase